MIRETATAVGFDAVGFAPVTLGEAEERLMDWLAAGYQGGMDYMAAHGVKRARPAQLVAGTRSVISVRLDYGLPAAVTDLPGRVVIARYALGRDYHKLLRQRLQRLADTMTARIGPFMYRAFTDSAPVMEVELARLAGLGWRGKHTLILSRSGSWFFLGELFTDLDMPPDDPEAAHCGTCRACLEACPTSAFVAPYVLDARRCISYLTIEHAGAIPEALRPAMGQRVYGCDDCQTACPWNRHARAGSLADFLPRNGLERASLVELFMWREKEFLERLAGSPIRRIGHERWLRNLAIGLGNLKHSDPERARAVQVLRARASHPSALVREHVAWALARLLESAPSTGTCRA